MNLSVSMLVKTEIKDAATGKTISLQPFKPNLILNQGLNSLAQRTITGVPASSGLAGSFTNVIVGSGTTPVKIASGGVTFTQASVTLTASGGFFTASMVGMLFKWGTGTGGVEVYITGYTSATVVTVADANTVTTPDVGTVWAVSQTSLVTQVALTGTKSYSSTPGNNFGPTLSGSICTYQRVFVIPQQANPYNVNEIGWCSNSVSIDTNYCCGRIVLASTDVIATTNFYVVTLQLQMTITPATPTAVPNVGTNINTSGTAAVETTQTFNEIISSGITVVKNGLEQDNAAVAIRYIITNYSQNTNLVTTAGPSVTDLNTVTTGGGIGWVWDSSATGRKTLSSTSSVTTSGQSVYGIGVCYSTTPCLFGFDVKLTTPHVLPVGTFQPNTVFAVTYGRNLTN